MTPQDEKTFFGGSSIVLTGKCYLLYTTDYFMRRSNEFVPELAYQPLIDFIISLKQKYLNPTNVKNLRSSPGSLLTVSGIAQE